MTRKEEQNYYLMDNRELRKLIIKDLEDLGIENKSYSLKVKNYSLDKGINILIKSPYVNADKVEKVLQKYKHVDFCEVTYETLQGCNVYLGVSYDYDIFDCIANEYLELAKSSIDQVKQLDNGYGYKVLENDDSVMYLFKENNTITMSLKNLSTNLSERLVVNGARHLSINIFKAINHGFIS